MHRPAALVLTALTLALCICLTALLPGGSRANAQQKPPSLWTIGVLTGPSPFELNPPAGVKNPVLTAAQMNAAGLDIVAHPFMLVTDSMYYMYFTAKNSVTEEGGIGLAESRDGLRWNYRGLALDEPFVLAYPYVFELGGQYYMIPETHKETSLRLYRASAFPDKWEYVCDLLSGEHYISASVVRYRDTWWMYVAASGNETLRLFYADELKGPWTEHPKSPVVRKNLDTARPAGRPLVLDGVLYRLGQDCAPTYGNQVHAFKVTEISRTAYREEMLETPVVKATGSGWNAEAMHHVDAHRRRDGSWIAVVDALGVI